MRICYASWYSKHIAEGEWQVFTNKESNKYANEILAAILPIIEHATPGTSVETIGVVQNRAFLVKVGNEEHGGIIPEVTSNWESELHNLTSQLLNKASNSLGICIRPIYRESQKEDKTGWLVIENILKENPRIQWICVLQGGTKDFIPNSAIFLAKDPEYSRLLAKLNDCIDIGIIKLDEVEGHE